MALSHQWIAAEVTKSSAHPLSPIPKTPMSQIQNYKTMLDVVVHGPSTWEAEPAKTP